MNDKKSITSNLFWRFAERVLAQLVAFIVSILLARILGPDAYGEVALITVFTIILQVFVDSGLGTALIQKKDSDDIDFSTVFYTNVIFCILLYLLIFLLSPAIASFYNDEELIPYIRVLSITVLISGVKNVQQSYVSKHMMFKKFFFSTLGGTIVAGIVGVTMAIKGFGLWALVAQQVINLAIDTLILWITVKWRPIRAFSFTRLKVLFSFGWKMLLSNLIDTVYKEVRQLIIGKIYSSEDLAFYNKGNQMPNLIIKNINTSIDSVLLPAMSRVQDDREHVRSMTRRSIKISVFVMAPLMIGLLSIGEPLIRLLLTEEWLPCVPFMRIFCITYMFYPIHTANLNAIKAMGRSDLFLKMEIIKKFVGIIALIITMNISVKAMAYSLLITTLISQVINSWPNRKLLKYSYFEQIIDILPSIILSAFMGGIVYCISFFKLSDLLTLLIQIPLGAIIYIVGSKLLKINSFDYIWGIVKSYINIRKKSS